MAHAYEETESKRKYLERQGYIVKTIWSCEWVKLKKEDEDARKFMSELEITPPLAPHEAFYGGRTNAVKLYHECAEDEKIHYIDVVSISLYSKYLRTVNFRIYSRSPCTPRSISMMSTPLGIQNASSAISISM